jgi:Family of unknown function (DUF6461)
MTAVDEDYLWFGLEFPELAEAYCVTLVEGLAPAMVLHRFGATVENHLTGVDEVRRQAFAAWDHYRGDRMLVAATAVEGWTLVVEPNGYLGVTEECAIAVSHGTRLVSHFRNVNAVDHFYWIEDGQVRLYFEPLFAYYRTGTAAESAADAMRSVGFDLSDTEDRDIGLHTEATFALAEHITGIRLTPEQLRHATYVCGHAPAPIR